MPPLVTTLMERTNTGLLVELRLVGTEVYLFVKDGEEEGKTVRIDPESAMEAFHHPLCGRFGI